MTIAQGTRTRLSVGEQADFTTPATTLRELPINSHSLNLSKARVESGELRPDRQISVDRQGNRQIGGDISVEMRDTDFDILLKSAFFNDFVDVQEGSGQDAVQIPTLRIGTGLRFLTLEDAMLDVDVYRRFTGCAVSSMNLSVAPNSMVLATFGVVGRDMTVETSELATPSDPVTDEPWDSYTGSIEVAGAETTLVTSVDLTLDNGVAPLFAIGSAEAPQLEFGRATVTGSLTAFFDDVDMYNRFVNETETSVALNLNDKTSSGTDTGYRIVLPRVKFNSGELSVVDERSRLLTIEFMAIRDNTTEDTIRIEKRIT